MNQALIGYLFNTKAIRVCPKDKPFWYTSGKIGPYYINTHFLYGSEEKANAFLADIDRLKEDKLSCSGEIHKLSKKNYLSDPVYKGTIDALADYVKEHLTVDAIDYISGGERRDWFFSFMLAEILNKPHITLFKDQSAVIYSQDNSYPAQDLNYATVLHVADLITTASSYERAWVPAIQNLNGHMQWSLVVVDRLQGGAQVLEKLGVESHSLVAIDASVFEKACRSGYIDPSQLELVFGYMKDPEGSMKAFLKEHPEFLHQTLQDSGKNAERAQLLLQSNFYDVNSFIVISTDKEY